MMIIIKTSEYRAWNNAVKQIKCAGTFYAHNFAKAYSGVKLYVYARKRNIAVFPFRVTGDCLVSLRYGGILCKRYDPRFLKEALSQLYAWCKGCGIKKIIVREHPFLHIRHIGRIVKKEQFVYIDLSRPKAKLEQALSRRHQECIRIATKTGLIFAESRHPGYLKLFYRLYAPMLKKKNIAPESFVYFKRLYKNLKSNLSFSTVKYKDKIVAVSISLRSAGDIYMMYGGMDKTGYRKYAKHFMIYNLIFQLKKRGYRRLVLGTGEKPGDSIYMFKRGFTDESSILNTYEKIVPFMVTEA